MPAAFEVDVDPYLQARRARHMRGSIALVKLKRLVAALNPEGASYQNDTDVDIDVQFSRGAGGRVQFQLVARATLLAQCQRCLGEVSYTLDVQRQMMVVSDEADVVTIPAEFEPVLMQDEKLSLLPVIEDELLLSLPIVVKHSHCTTAMTKQASNEAEFEERVNPFSVLGQMKGKD